MLIPHHGESDDTANSEGTDQRGYGGSRDWGDADEERDQGRSQVDDGENLKQILRVNQKAHKSKQV